MLQIKQRLAAAVIAASALATLSSVASAESFAGGNSAIAHALSATQVAADGPRRGLGSEVERYANRERVTPALGNFRGGDTIVVGASSIALVLAIVLVLVML